MSKNTLAPIARWTVEHEQIVSLHIMQWSNEDIAKRFNKTPARISQILSDPQARRIVNEAVVRIRSNMLENLEDGIGALAIVGLQRMKETIEFSEFVLGSDAKKHQDRLALDLAKLVYANNTDMIKEELPLDAAMAQRIAEAIEASNVADALIQEAQFVEVIEGE